MPPLASQHGKADRKFQHKLDDINTRLTAPLVPVGREAVVAAQVVITGTPCHAGPKVYEVLSGIGEEASIPSRGRFRLVNSSRYCC